MTRGRTSPLRPIRLGRTRPRLPQPEHRVGTAARHGTARHGAVLRRAAVLTTYDDTPPTTCRVVSSRVVWCRVVSCHRTPRCTTEGSTRQVRWAMRRRTKAREEHRQRDVPRWVGPDRAENLRNPRTGLTAAQAAFSKERGHRFKASQARRQQRLRDVILCLCNPVRRICIDP